MTDHRPTRIAAVLTVHDRADLTVACLQALQAQAADVDGHVLTVVFDDGSSDGTADRIQGLVDDLVVLHGDGSFFWNGGMRVAMAHAMHADPDHVLWLNDDTTLAPGALATLLRVQDDLGGPSTPAIVCGAVTDPDDGSLTYSGVRRDRVRRLHFHQLRPGPTPRRVESMNGNCVLIPRAVLERVGNLSPAYQHGMGDYDYGLRATAAGAAVWLAPGVLGSCRANPGFVRGEGTLAQELARFRSTKHLPPADWAHFARRWGGPAWPLLWASPYVRRAIGLLRP